MSKYSSSYSFNLLRNSSKALTCNKCVRFIYNFSNDQYLYLMIARKYGSAPLRNTFKRRAKVLFDGLVKQYSHLSIGLMVTPLKKDISYQELQQCFNDFNKKILVEKN